MSFQGALQPLLMGEALEARLHDLINTTELIFGDVPVDRPDVRTNLVDALEKLNAAVDNLKASNHVTTLTTVRLLTVHMHQHGHLPPFDDRPAMQSDSE